jgi:hypothetical protein
MQAMYAYGHAAGRAESFVEIADRCVRVLENGSEEPRAGMHDGYRQAREDYRSLLVKLYLGRD